ncbi:MAG: orotidine-5'-phosphate decarboxylase [Bacteroidota bacterium]
MTREELLDQIKRKRSFLCVGLDPDLNRIPQHLLECEDPVFEFNKQIINATEPFAVAYKPNIAFFEALGSSGWDTLKKTVNYIPAHIFKIADAKRGDIGNTSSMYAKTFFEQMSFDAITITPYMGSDSVQPFLKFKNKWSVILAATSNSGAVDFQYLKTGSEFLYQQVVRKSSAWGSADNMMYVVGATRPETLTEIRKIIPEHFLLIPGVGAQGGDLKAVCNFGMTDQVGLLINSSRGIIYAANDENFAEAASLEAKKVRDEMATILKSKYPEI